MTNLTISITTKDEEKTYIQVEGLNSQEVIELIKSTIGIEKEKEKEIFLEVGRTIDSGAVTVKPVNQLR